MATPQQDLQPARDLVVADSTALTRSSDDDEATPSARRDGSQEPLTPPRPSFATLPDELIAEIYSHLAEWLWKPSETAVNKRIHEIARRFAIRNIYVEGTLCSKLAWLAAHDDASSGVKCLEGNLPASLPHLQTSVFSMTPNLTRLSIFFVDAGGLSPLPDYFFEILKRLRRLTSLEIKHDERHVPKDGFSFDRNVPSLRELSISAIGTLSACAPGLANIEDLTLCSPTRAESATPWQSLHHFAVLYPEDAEDAAGLHQVLQSLVTACKTTTIPLQSLVLSRYYLAGPEELDLPSFAELFDALRLTHLTDLTIIDVWDVPDLRVKRMTLPTILRLTLRTYPVCERVTQSLLGSLRALLALFPALQTLRLERIQLYRDRDFFGRTTTWELSKQAKAAILRSTEQGDLASSFPTVDTLLGFLRLTAVLDFLVELSGGVGIHWRRFSREEDFIAEGWSEI